MCSRCWPPSPGLGGRPQRTTPGGPTWDRRSCCKSLPEPRRSIPASLGIDPIRDLDNSASKTLARFGNFLRASCGFASALTGGGWGVPEAAGPAPPPAVTSSLAGIALRGGGSIWSAGGAGWQAGPAPPAAGGAACTIYSTSVPIPVVIIDTRGVRSFTLIAVFAACLAGANSCLAQPAPTWTSAVAHAAEFSPAARIVVLDVATGHLLASSHLPEAAVTLAAPGSTLKPLVLYGLVASGRWDPSRRIACSRKLTIAGRSLNCSHPPADPMDARQGVVALGNLQPCDVEIRIGMQFCSGIGACAPYRIVSIVADEAVFGKDFAGATVDLGRAVGDGDGLGADRPRLGGGGAFRRPPIGNGGGRDCRRGLWGNRSGRGCRRGWGRGLLGE